MEGEPREMQEPGRGAQPSRVTAVRRGGVEEPDPRRTSATGRRPGGLERVGAGTAEERFRQRCETAETAAVEVAARVVGVASQFRQQDVAAGHPGLVRLARDLRGLLTLLNPILEIDATFTGGQVVHLGDLLASLIAAQETQDWLTVSDILEYDLEPALRRWERTLHAAAAAAGPPMPIPA